MIEGETMAEFTPMMRQYLEIKETCQDAVLLYRLGDFYEMFFDDAKLVSKELDLVLTGKDCGQEERAPMCGIPYHSSENYIAKLVKNGHKVCICEQTEDPKKAKGLVRREIIRTITPGTVIAASMLDEDCNNYIASVYLNEAGVGICFADITTGEVLATDMSGSNMLEYACRELGRFQPHELLFNCAAANEKVLNAFVHDNLTRGAETMPETAYDPDTCTQQLRERFAVCAGEPWEEHPLVICATGALLTYLTQTQQQEMSGMDTIQLYQQGQYLELDMNARRNLELFETMRTKEKKGSLLWVMDKTRCAMGARMLRQWLGKPLRSPNQILRRQQAVAELKENFICRQALMEELRQIFDMERLITRVVYASANCRDLRTMHATLEHVPAIRAQLEKCSAPLLQTLAESMDELEDIKQLIDCAIRLDGEKELPFSVREGGFIRDGYSEELDKLRNIANGGANAIAEMEQREREATGIAKLKIGYNRVFGYYIEISKLYADSVPPNYVRKQTLANCERYITEELKQFENMILQAQDSIAELEYQLFTEVREQISAAVHRVQRTSQTLAQTDVLCSLAEIADLYNYCCPEVSYSPVIDIKDGRHPVVERVLRETMFIPNDTLLDDKANRVAIITGPNMAGKSTYMRQVALITIMAQMGSFVPAREARIGIADRVFTRVGASDDLASGQSTFMVEMSEVADILQHATRLSLVVLDEIGRGTSTFDGMSIARAVVEYIADPKRLGARTLFATHYHELTALEDMIDGIKNYNIAVKKRGDDITFLRKIVPGGADDSFGIAVAKLAGIPKPVLRRAKSILKDLEATAPKLDLYEMAVVQPEEEQISLADIRSNEIGERLCAVNLNTITPIEAMNLLFELQKMAQS